MVAEMQDDASPFTTCEYWQPCEKLGPLLYRKFSHELNHLKPFVVKYLLLLSNHRILELKRPLA